MNSFVEKFKKMFFSREFIVFVIIGVANTFNGVVFAYIYSNLLNENLAFIFGYMSGLIISYILNSKITFKEELKLIKFVRFALSN
ncbi:MAG TPA: GtrA family protein, partial [Clostridium sp.]